MKYSGQFRNTVWDPVLIISQIVSLQSVFYVTLGIWIVILNFLVGTSRSLDYVFKYQEVHVRDSSGQLVILAFLLNALTGAVGLWWLVGRTKLCLDFTCTAHFIHLLLCWFYNSCFPTSLSWWLLQTACMAIMCICGEFLCVRTEMNAIPLGGVPPKVDL